MANKPDDPNAPHTPEEGHGDPTKPDLGKKKPPTESDSGIDLGTPDEGVENSGISVIEWAALVEDPAAPSSKSSGEMHPPVPEVVDEIPAEPNVGEVFESDSAIDLGAAEQVADPSGKSAIDLGADAVVEEAQQPVSGDSAIDFGADVQVVEESAQPVSESAIDLPADAVVEEGGDLSEAVTADSAIDLGGEGVVELSPDDVLAMSPSDSGIDLHDAVPPGEGGSGVRPLAPGESGIDLIDEDVILEEPATSGNGSSRDLIAEGLESGMDLRGTKQARSEEHEDALDDFLAKVGSEDPSSAVDLGSTHSIDVFDPGSQKSIPPKSAAPTSDLPLEVTGEAGAEESPPIDIEVYTDPDALDSGAHRKPAAADSAETEALDLGALAGSAAAEERKSDEEVDLGAVGPAGVEVEEHKSHKGKKKPLESDEPEAGEDDSKKKKKPAPAGEDGGKKPRSRAVAWLGGMMLGGLAASAAMVGVWLFAEPPREWRNSVYQTVGMDVPKDDGKGKGTGGSGNGKVQPPVVTFVQTAEKIRSGDFEKVSSDELAKLDENDPAQLVARAEVAWLNYLKAQRGKDLKADAPPVQNAMTDLNKAVEKNSADALFLRGQIHELTGNEKLAETDYKAGVEKFKGEAEQRERFEAALLAMEVGRKTAGLLPRQVTPRMLALVLIHLQAAQPGDQPQKTPDEAGFRFWQAIKAMREAKKSDDVANAIKLLDEARTRHDARRYVMLRKPQNPLSDPREEIFLRVCDELKAYWSLRGKLRDPDSYLALDNKERDPAVDAIVKKADAAGRTAQLKELGEKLAKDKPVAKPEDLIKLIAEERKASAAMITTLEKDVEEQKKAITKLEVEKKDANDKLKTTAGLLDASTKREKDLQGSLKAADKTLAEVADVVNVKFKDVKTSGPDLLKEVKDTARMAKTADPAGTIRKLEGELTADRAKLKERWEPVEMLPVWLAVLESDRSRSDLHPSIQKDIRRVENDTASKTVDKARAQALAGLILRNEDRFADSRKTLEKAKSDLDDPQSKWGVAVESALAEVSNPAATYSRRAEELAARNRPAEAVAVLKKGLDVVPDKKGPLYARRAQIALDAARSKGALEKDDPAVAAAKRDADEAVKEGLADGHYVLGQIAEETGQLEEAIKSYRAAVAAHKAADAAGSRYRVALARALLKTRVEDRRPRPAPPRDRTGKAAPKQDEGLRRAGSLELLSLLVSLTLQAPGLPNTEKNVKEAEKLADDILKDDKAPFDARASAFAVKGLYTRALNTYVEGLREKGLLASGYANGLLELVRDHPGLKRPESLAIPDPTAGEKAYAAGLVFFANRKYVEAEREFLSAVENDNGDARYYYYLGLSRLAQGKRDAIEDFDTGARLERLGRPDRATVSQALERVQGSMRRTLNDVRNRPVKDRAK